MSSEPTQPALSEFSERAASGEASPAKRQRVLSGVQPTSALHLGNYLGALRQWVKLQDERDCFFCIVDLHAITLRQDPKELSRRTRELAALYIAAGIDPERSTIFVQSHVPEHCELQWILSTFAQFGELNKMTQFKDKSRKNETNINVGLFCYPVLMAADILLYDADLVPVGEDQKQHLELARNIAIRFNNAYEKSVFAVPDPMIPREGARIMDLQKPESKMSKSEEPKGTLGLLDPLPELKNKVKRAVTDSLAKVALDRENQPGVANLLNIIAAIEEISVEEAAARFQDQGYAELKEAAAAAVERVVGPIQERFKELNNKKTLDPILAQGARRAREVARRTLARAKKTIGFLPPAES
jgi:tryptophanyl-tRNA synthetase